MPKMLTPKQKLAIILKSKKKKAELGSPNLSPPPLANNLKMPKDNLDIKSLMPNFLKPKKKLF